MRARKLTKEQVIHYRELYRQGEASAAEISEKAGMAHSAAWMMLTGRAYTDIPGAVQDGVRRGRRKLTDEQVSHYREQYRNGLMTVKEISEEVGMGYSPAWMMVKGKTYADVPGAVKIRSLRKLTDEQVAHYRDQYRNGQMSITEVSEDSGMSIATARLMLIGKTYSDLPGAVKIKPSCINETAKQEAERAARKAKRDKKIAAMTIQQRWVYTQKLENAKKLADESADVVRKAYGVFTDGLDVDVLCISPYMEHEDEDFERVHTAMPTLKRKRRGLKRLKPGPRFRQEESRV